MSDNEHTKYMYKHDSAQAFTVFTARLAGKAVTIDKVGVNIVKILEGSEVPADACAAASNALYYLMIGMIGNDDLIVRLVSDYPKQGIEAFKYIKESWLPGNNEDKLEDTFDKYSAIMSAKYPATMSGKDLMKKFNEAGALLAHLKGSDFEISACLHSRYLVKLVRGISERHALEVALVKSSFDHKTPSKTAGILEGIVEKVKSERKESSVSTLFASMNEADKRELAALFAKGTPKRGVCDGCGSTRHPLVGMDRCYAVMLSRGETVPGWDRMSANT